MTNPNGFMQVNYAGLLPILVEALKEEYNKTDSMERRVQELRAQMLISDYKLKIMEQKVNAILGLAEPADSIR